MRLFLSWAMAVTRHWVLLLGGAGVSVAMLVWSTYAPSGQDKLPSMVWWTGIVIGFIGACFLSWKEEWLNAAALAIKRPEFVHNYAGLEQWQRQDGTLVDGKFNIKFAYTNPSGIGADELTWRVVGIVYFDDDPLTDSGFHTSANRTYDQKSIRSPINVYPDMPPCFFVVDVSYKDARTGAAYWQQMFYKWIGTRATDFDMHFRTCSMEERRLIEAYLATKVTPSMIRTAAPSLLQGS